jgi:hypothetical protein
MKLQIPTDIHLVQIPTPSGPVTVPLPSPFSGRFVGKFVSLSNTRMLKRTIAYPIIMYIKR